VKKVRVLVANRSRMMRDLVIATVADQPDIEVIAGEIDSDSDIERAVAEQQPDFVIITFDKPNQRPALCDHLLSLYPQVRVLAISPTVNKSSCFWTAVDIHSATFESSEAGLLGVLRGAKVFTASERVN
jgi:chemotaxis response regulator CheB